MLVQKTEVLDDAVAPHSGGGDGGGGTAAPRDPQVSPA